MSVALDWFYDQDKETQEKLLAYNSIRETEEAHLLQASLSVGLTHGI